MKINHGRVAGTPSLLEGETFTGDVWVDLVLDEVKAVMGYNVFFTPGARTDWHRHSGGQILFITAGSGMVVSRRTGTIRVGAGNVVWTEPDEEHWHGADAHTYMLHAAVSLGEPVWLEAVTDREYADAGAAVERA